MNTYLNGRKMRALISTDRCELLNGQIGVREARGSKVGRLELGEGLRVELALEILEDTSKLWKHKDECVSGCR